METDHRKTVTLVLGGVRSGKSRYAQQLGERVDRVMFVATAQALDDEMQRKIDRHRDSRPHHWTTVEEPLALAETILQRGPSCDLMIIDCLTFFATNLLQAQAAEDAVEDLCAALAEPPCSVVLVSNEVGSGVVPPYPLGRRFRDLLGEMNQRVARVSSHVLLLVAGLPLVLKGHGEENR
jgi:adenosylcobinamide kinase/adenosylcobinamide-phosphate guanylyltransferase